MRELHCGGQSGQLSSLTDLAPLASPERVVEQGNVHATPSLARTYSAAKAPDCRERRFAVHYTLPADWAAREFDDSAWPEAATYTDVEIGFGSLTGYTGYPEAFAGAQWIWSANLVFDNLLLARKTVR